MTGPWFKNLRPISIAIALGILTIGVIGCNEEPRGQAHGVDRADAEYERGPMGGRMLRDGDFSLEITIFEAGQDPQFQVYPRLDDEPLDLKHVRLSITLGRLDGERDHFDFVAAGGYLAGQGVVTEPHSFDVKVEAEHGGHRYAWSYESYEGRTVISAEAAKIAGVETEPAGPAELVETLELLGRVDFAPGARVEVHARFPGQVKKVLKSVGDRVRVGETVAVVESNESLRAYNVSAPLDGVIVERMINTGEFAGDRPIFVIGDLARLSVDFHVFPGDVSKVRPGQSVIVRALDGGHEAETTVATLLPTAETATQALISRVQLANPEMIWVPGLLVKGVVSVSQEVVPLAVRIAALQRFRDFTVVFARVDETYEVRMLELGRRSSEWAEVLRGLKPGQPYVTRNSFLIKADIEKSGASHDH